MDQIQNIITEQVCSSLSKVEAKLDTEFNRLKTIEEINDFELDEIRDRRKNEMKKKYHQRSEWLSKGHGEYTKVCDQAEFFTHAKSSEMVVAHFHNKSNMCRIADLHMEKCCKKHIETKFIKVDVEKSPFLVKRLNIWMLPSFVLIKKCMSIHTILGFDEFGGTEDFSNEMFCYVLGKHGIINHNGVEPKEPKESNESSYNVSRIHKRERFGDD